MSPKNITAVLVPGAWADGSSWGKVVRQLQSSGLGAVTAPLPLTSHADDVAALERTLERVDGPVVLVGHAYAGGVIGGTPSDKVKALVYVAALAPHEGETVADVFYRAEPHPKAPKLAPDRHGLIWLPEEAFADAFAQNASLEEQALLAAVQRPISPACITVPVSRPRWRDLPCWYLIAEDDRMIPRATQEFMAERMNAQRRSHPVDHIPSVTAPDLVTDLIVRAAREIRQA
jgi:pimeloyl-ACP methyl ester carboxylesterase